MSEGSKLLELKGRAARLRSKVDAARARAPKEVQDALDAIAVSVGPLFSSAPADDALGHAQIALANLEARWRLLIDRGYAKPEDLFS